METINYVLLSFQRFLVTYNSPAKGPVALALWDYVDADVCLDSLSGIEYNVGLFQHIK